MGFFDRAIKKGIGSAISGAVEKVASEVIAPAADKAAQKVAEKTTDYANKTAATLDEATREMGGAVREADAAAAEAGMGSLGGLFSSFQSAAVSFAGAAAQNMKICEACGAPGGAEEKFCPSCGAPLPEATVGALYVCSSCGKQNDVGKKFCTDCGAKLPATLQEEARAAAKNEETLAQWEVLLPQFPKWPYGGANLDLEQYDEQVCFHVDKAPRATLLQYRELLKQSGFRPAGRYPSEDMLYKMVGGECWCFESCEPYPGDADSLSVSFGRREPDGGFDYVKPEPKKQPDLGDLVGGLGDLKGGLKGFKDKFKF